MDFSRELLHLHTTPIAVIYRNVQILSEIIHIALQFELCAKGNFLSTLFSTLVLFEVKTLARTFYLSNTKRVLLPEDTDS